MTDEILEDKVSKCCKSAIGVHIAFEGTGCYVCVKCGKACDPDYPDQFVDTNKKIESKPPDECHCHRNCPGAHGGKKIGKDLSVSCLCYPRDCEHCKPMQNKSNLGKSEQMKDNKDEHNCDVMGCPSVGPHKQTKEGWEEDWEARDLWTDVECDWSIGDGGTHRELDPDKVKTFIYFLLSAQQQKFEKDLREVIGEDAELPAEEYLKMYDGVRNVLRSQQRQKAKQLGYSVES